MTIPLTTLPDDPILDLDPWVGQRQASYRFALVNAVTGEALGDIHPIRGAGLTHDTTRTIKRQLSLQLGAADTAAVNPITDRVDVFMVFPGGAEYPLGRYMFTDASRQVYTAGKLGFPALNDEMFLVDQEIQAGISARGHPVMSMIQETLTGLPVTYDMESSPYNSAESWGVGTGRGQVLESLARSGDYFSPWFGHDKQMHFVRAFDPATRIPDFDFDAGHKVFREPILESDDLLLAPNRFVVISNAAIDPRQEVVGVADVPVTAPHSFANRGFYIQSTLDLQIVDTNQATAIARNLALRQTIFERVNLATAPDPRHDSYNVVRWRGELWLELAWSLALVEGGGMNHLLRKTYS